MSPTPPVATTLAAAAPRWAWLPPIGSARYYAMLALLGSLVLGPLGGVTASYMNFSIGFFVGGQVLAGILGSVVTLGYGPEGKHGANYMQTAAASVAGMAGMGVLIQAMAWMGLPRPPAWQLMLYLGAVGMFGAGIGMLYTPILVDRMRLTYPSGLAVANILRAMTDPALLRRAVARLFGGMGLGLAGGLAAAKVAVVGAIEFSASTFGAGMLVGARVGVPALVAGLTGAALLPTFVAAGWLEPGDPFRKITFLVGLGMILGAAVLDVGGQLRQALSRWRASAPAAAMADEPWRRTNTKRLVAWTGCWGAAVLALGVGMMGQPFFFMAFAVGLTLVIVLVNGIALGVSDSNPISAAFVVAIVLMVALGLREPTVGLMAGGVLLVATSVAGDMQQDRSTGWRLGTPRTLQFRFQVLGLLVGAVASVAFAELFMRAYPVLLADQTAMKADEQPAQWVSAMTYKFVGALRGITDDQPQQRSAIALGVVLGLAMQTLRKWLFARDAYRRWCARSAATRAGDFVLDAVLLPSPYAYSFGTFFGVATSAWMAAGSVLAGVSTWASERRGRGPSDELPPDMSTVSLVGGGLIAGDALAALGLGVVSLVAMLA
jgi:uncharacterized oligopeptide transporter (OPT) family protein